MAIEFAKNSVIELSSRTARALGAPHIHSETQAKPANENAPRYQDRRPVHSIRNVTAIQPAKPATLDTRPYRNAVPNGNL